MTGVAWQRSLLAGGAPEPDRSFGRLVRHQLDEETWVDHAPEWLAGSDALFDWLAEHAPWNQPEMTIYGRRLPYARLVASWPYDPPHPVVPPPLEDLRALLSVRYDVCFDSVSVNLYRNGRDSVAWHGDRIARTVHRPIVVTISVGERRRFLLRPRAGGASTVFDLGRGDLLVMGGACQRTWQHTVPKVASAGPRMSITLRHSAGRGS